MNVGNSRPGRLLVIMLANLAVATLLMESVRAQVVPPARESVPERHRNDLDDRPGKDAIVTRQRLFSIPFAIDNPAKPPREIYLFVSGDRGARWSLYQKRPAADRKFDFQAGKDGEYWFAVGTDTVRIRPDRNTRPEKVVIVDTDLPRIDLRVSVLSPGRLSARWYAADDTLSPGTFRLSYRTDASTDWKQIDVILPRDTSPEFDGEVSWMVADSGTIYVRGEIMDRAGNVGSSVRDVPAQDSTHANGSRDDRYDSREYGQTPQRDEQGRADVSWRDEQSESDELTNEFDVPESPWETGPTPEIGVDLPQPENASHARENVAEFVDRREPLPDAPLGDDASYADDWPNRRSERREPVRRHTRWTSEGEASMAESPTGREDRNENNGSAGRLASDLTNDRWRDRPPLKDREIALPAPEETYYSGTDGNVTAGEDGDDASRSIANPYSANPYSANPYSADPYAEYSDPQSSPVDDRIERSERPFGQELGDSAGASDLSDDYNVGERDSAVQAQVTSSKEFNLDYDVTDLGTGELARVELWVTQNNGQSWEPYGTDQDLQSPFFVEVEHEGRYGFQLLIHSSSGQSTRPPQLGDRPDMSIEVDTSKPSAYLAKAYFPRGETELEIEWQATDKNMSANGCTLSYAETRNGPWVIIARDLPNTGSYTWNLPDNLPRTIRLQIDVLDKAGNRTVHQLEEATPTKPANPRARIQGIRAGS